jgi:hypothetical protein
MEETFPGYITCSASEDRFHLFHSLNFHLTSTKRHETFLKARVILSTLSFPVFVILQFIIFLPHKANFRNIFSSFRCSQIHYIHFLQRKSLLIFKPPLKLCDLIITSITYSEFSCVRVSASYPGSHFRIQWNLRFYSNTDKVTFIPHILHSGLRLILSLL